MITMVPAEEVPTQFRSSRLGPVARVDNADATVVTMQAVFASESEFAFTLQPGSADRYGNYAPTRALAVTRYFVFALTVPLFGPLNAKQIIHFINPCNQAREVTPSPNAASELSVEAPAP